MYTSHRPKTQSGIMQGLFSKYQSTFLGSGEGKIPEVAELSLTYWPIDRLSLGDLNSQI
jgi:hypothetical protein